MALNCSKISNILIGSINQKSSGLVKLGCFFCVR
nr:MAG TPA: hypothetical protein [Caudoviricetes sp.]DAH55869.1 MAG TPA: hypothetical protein [Caudoviricetes sp.]DAZ29523.1 MAG TPA: hypothetical protein [Caudoviricetes sp.]